MKQYATRFLKTVAMAYLAFPILYLPLITLLFDIPAQKIASILLSPFFYLISTIAIVSGYGLWEMRRWSWYLFFLANILVGYSNAYLLTHYGSTHHSWAAFLTSILVIAFIVFRVSKEVRVPYFLPKIRWWESNPRYRTQIPVKIQNVNAEIVDLSVKGAFIKVREDFLIDSNVQLKFEAYGISVEVTGIVVWCPQSSVTHPKGIGVKFLAMNRQTRRSLRLIDVRLKRIRNFYRTYRLLMSDEEFSKRMLEFSQAIK